MLHMSEEHETLINYTEEKPRVIQICRSLTQATLATDLIQEEYKDISL